MASAGSTVHENDTKTTVHIFPDGDVVFVIGQTKRRLRVYSRMVTIASPVLNAMLGLGFLEGQQLAETGSTEIALPDDKPEAMEIIFNVIHGRNNEVQETLGPDELLQVAIAVDKYDCFVSMSFAIQTWFSRTGVTKSKHLWAMAMAACLFQRQEAFEEATSALVFNHSGSYIHLAREYEAVIDPTIPLRTAVMLEEARSVLRIELLMELLDSDWHRHCYASSKEGRHPPDWLTKLVRRCDLNTVSISDALSVLIRDVSIPTAGTDDFWCVWDWASSFKAMMQDFKAKHEKAARLCVRYLQQTDCKGERIKEMKESLSGEALCDKRW